MRTITIRDLRQRWPEAEQALRTEAELVVTRDGQPVARLVRFVPQAEPLARFDPEAHVRWQRKMGPGQPVALVDKYLGADRDDPGR